MLRWPRWWAEPFARRARLLLWPAGAVVGVAAEWRLYGWADPSGWVPDLLTGWCLMGCGLAGWARRPQSRSGLLLVAAGFAWFVPDFAAAGLGPLAWLSAHEPVAYLMADLVDGCLQIEQVTVHPGGARRGLGRALLDHAANRAAAEGLPALTLTTFAHVPWNAPYYARCGFGVLNDAEITPGLQAIRDREAAMGLDRWPRVCMRRDL